jgi:DNA-binding MarR family transcriptional regulator
MPEEKIWISQLSYKKITLVIRAYADYGVSGKINDIAKKSGIDRQYISRASRSLEQLGIIEEDGIKTHRRITEKGLNLARAIHLGNSDNIKKYWAELIRDTPYILLLQKFQINQEVSENELLDAIFRSSKAKYNDTHKIPGVNSIIEILCESGCIKSIDGKKYLIIRNSLPPNPDKFPLELRPYIEKFYMDHPDSSRCAFIMMPFSDTQYYVKYHKQYNDNFFELIKEICLNYHIEALRADSKYYTKEILPNIKTYMWGCDLGIAIFEKLENNNEPDSEGYNPNVSLEVGYMMALKKTPLLLKDSRISKLHSDLIPIIYDSFDADHLQETIPPIIEKWLRDNSLI